MRTHLITTLLLMSLLAQAQYSTVLSTEQIATGYAITIGERHMIGYSQPALLADADASTIYASGERRYVASLLGRSIGGHYIMDEHSGTALVYRHYGLDTYRDQQLRLSYGRRLSDALSLGLALNWHRLSIEGYGHSTQYSPTVGLVLDLTDRTRVSTLYQYSRGTSNEGVPNRSPHTVAGGILHQLSDIITLGGEISYQEDRLSISGHLRYTIHPQLEIIIGVADHMSTPSFGIYWCSEIGFDISISSARHHDLGNTTSLSIGYRLGS